MPYGTVNADVIGTSVTGSNLGAGNATRFKNRIINGDMRIDQRSAGASITGGTQQYTLDRWQYYGSQASKFTIQQNAGSVTPPVGFSNYFGATVASAVTVGTNDYFGAIQTIEGFNFADMAFGTANAKTVTLSFQVYSSLTGTFGGSLQNAASTRSYPFNYTISSANTWTQISVTIAGDTSGTWVGSTNAGTINIIFNFGVGSARLGTANTWATANYWAATGSTSVVGTAGATFYFTGVQLEVGSSATGFDYRDYGTELVMCQRYFQYAGNSLRAYTSDGYWGMGFPYSVITRTTPTTTYISADTINVGTPTGVIGTINIYATNYQWNPGVGTWYAYGAKISVSAEL